MKKYVLALDQGTTSSRAIVFDKQGEVKGMAHQEFKQIYPKAGWVEHDPKEIYATQIGVVAEALIKADCEIEDIIALGITNQRETTIVWDKKTGEPVHNAIVWQCRRTDDYCEQLKKDGYEQMIFEKTGLVIDAYFSATKIKWILDNVQGARERANKGELLFGTIDTYLMWKMSKGEIFSTDYTNASRTMLFNVHTLEWDEDLLRLFDVPKIMLPTVKPSSALYGMTASGVLGKSLPICGVAGDQQSALFGQLCVEKGNAKNTYGTGCFLLMNTGDECIQSKNGLLTTLGATATKKPCYVLEGSVFIAGALCQWLRDEMRMIKTTAETEIYASRVSDTNGMYFVPAFTGLGAPHWDSEARGTITGLTRGVTKDHFIRAGLESIAYQVADVIDAMQKDSGIKINTLKVDGGASANNFLMQFQADVSNCRVNRPEIVEATALGCAYLAGLCVGYWKDINEIKAIATKTQIFEPNMSEENRKKLIDGWKKALRQSRTV